MDIMKMGRNCVVINQRAYVPEETSCAQLMEFDEELKGLEQQYDTVFEATALYHFYRDFGMRPAVVSILAQIQVGAGCIVSVGNSDMKITRVSKSFYIGEWVQTQHNYCQQQYYHPHSECIHEEQEERQLLCN